MIVMVKDLPGAERFVERVVDVVTEMTLAFHGEDDAKVALALDRMRETLKRDLADTIGAKAAAEVSDAFVRTVMREKHRLEAKGGGSA